MGRCDQKSGTRFHGQGVRRCRAEIKWKDVVLVVVVVVVPRTSGVGVFALCVSPYAGRRSTSRSADCLSLLGSLS